MTAIHRAVFIKVPNTVMKGVAFMDLGKTTSLKFGSYPATDSLLDALGDYGISMVFADNAARKLLDSREKVLMAHLKDLRARNIKAENIFEEAVSRTFVDTEIFVLTHQVRAAIFLANPANIELLRLVDRVVVHSQETERHGSITSQLPSLSETDGNVMSGPNQNLLTAVLEGKVVPRSIPVKSPIGTPKR